MATEEAGVVVEKNVARGTAENTVGHTEMVDTKGQSAEPKPMAIKTMLHYKKMRSRTRGCDTFT